jgi:hypothetical protein
MTVTPREYAEQFYFSAVAGKVVGVSEGVGEAPGGVGESGVIIDTPEGWKGVVGGLMTQPTPEEDEASKILDRIQSELPEVEARTERLMRLYGL